MAIKISQMAEVPSLDGSEWQEVSKLSSTITISANTISALASDNSFNDSGSGFLDAGFAVGDQVKVTGFTGNVANNIFSAKITALTTAKMTIGGTDGDVIVNDSAGESVTITKWETYRTTAQEIADLAAILGVGSSESITISGTSANLDNDNKGKYHRFTNASAKSLTVQPNATEALDQDGEWHIRNVGAADLTIIEGSGVTINLPAGGTLVVPQGGTVTLKRVAEDELDLFGQVAAAA